MEAIGRAAGKGKAPPGTGCEPAQPHVPGRPRGAPEGACEGTDGSAWLHGSSPSMTVLRMTEGVTTAAPFPLCSPHHQCSPCTVQQGVSYMTNLARRSWEIGRAHV